MDYLQPTRIHLSNRAEPLPHLAVATLVHRPHCTTGGLSAGLQSLHRSEPRWSNSEAPLSILLHGHHSADVNVHLLRLHCFTGKLGAMLHIDSVNEFAPLCKTDQRVEMVSSVSPGERDG